MIDATTLALVAAAASLVTLKVIIQGRIMRESIHKQHAEEIQKEVALFRGDEKKIIRLINEYPREYEPLLAYIKVALEDKKWMELRRRSIIMTNKFPNRPEGWMFEGISFRKQNQLKEAEEIFKVARKKFPEDFGVAIESIQVLFAQCRFDDALKLCNQLIKRHPRNPNAYVITSNVLLRLDRFVEADQLLGSIVQKMPNNPIIAIQYAQLASLHHDWAESARRWNSVMQDFPGRWEGYTRLSEALRHLGNADKALPLAETAFAAFPRVPEVKTELDRARGS